MAERNRLCTIWPAFSRYFSFVNTATFVRRIFLLTFLVSISVFSRAQNRFQQAGIDSAAIQTKVNKEYQRLDSMRRANAARKTHDSLVRIQERDRLQHFRDSVITARNAKRIADSVARVEAKAKLERDKYVKDSIAAAVKRRMDDSISYARFKADSIQKRQREISDSMVARRKFVSDSTKLVRDSLQKFREALAKYKKSKHYQDSVEDRKAYVKDSLRDVRLAKAALIRNQRTASLDSSRALIKSRNDSMRAYQQHVTDSTRSAMQAANAKIKEDRQKFNDSVVAIRNHRMDSLKTIRDARAKKNEGLAKNDNKDKQNLKLSIDLHEKKKEEWTNEKLLKRPWIITRQIYQNTVTRYNAYYHAKRKYDESIQTMTKNNKEDYAKVLHLYPYNVEKSGASVSGNMDSVVRKASYSTQIHDPRSKWFDNLYMLMAKAYYVKQDYENTITTCQFIINEYKEIPKKTKRSIDTASSIATKEKGKKILTLIKHKPIRNDAIILLVKAYIATEQYGEALTMISLLEKDKQLPKKYLPQLMLAKADLHLSQANRQEAILALESGLKYKMTGKQKSRSRYILGQLYALEKNYDKSTSSFKKSFYRRNLPEMDFYTRLHIAENAAYGGGETKYAINQLNKIIHDPKYERFKSQALITLALIQKETNPDQAISTLQKSIDNKENKNNTVRATAFAELGAIYFSKNQYVNAKHCYDSAMHLGLEPPLENLDEVITKRNVLTDIVLYTEQIREQDSLLRLADMSEKDRKAAIKKELQRLSEEKKKNSLAKVESLKPLLKNGQVIVSNWYYNNQELRENGMKEFKTKWGNRKLEDNWRRQSANALVVSSATEEEEQDTDPEASQDLWGRIPLTPAKRDSCHYKIMTSYYNLGLAYYSQLMDYRRSTETFDTLLKKYPDTKYKKDIYYAQFLNYSQLKNEPQADYYKNLLKTDYGNSDLAKLVDDPGFIKGKEKGQQQRYENAYQLYKEAKYNEALSAMDHVEKGNPLMAKYKLMEALCHAGLKDLTKCRSGLTALISEFPDSPEQRRAQEVLAYLQQLEKTPQDSLSKEASSSSTVNNDPMSKVTPGVFIADPNAEYYVMVYLKNADNKTTAFKSGLSDYNMMKYGVEDYSTGMSFLTTTQALVTVQTFKNQQTAKKYFDDLKKEKLVFSQLKSSDYDLMYISKTNFMEVMKTRDIDGYYNFFKNGLK